MNRAEIICRLHNLAESDYKEFNLKIVPTKKEVLGVRLPALRKLAKEIAKDGWRRFLQEAEDDIYEEQMLQGLVVAYIKTDFSEHLRLIAEFVPKIENWAVCDSVCGTMKFVKKHREEFLHFLQPYLTSDKEFELRFGVVMLMNYYLDEKYIDTVLQIYDGINSEKYYVQMAVAWGISVCFVKFQEQTMDYLWNNSLDDFTYNKSLQKITDSLRVDRKTKEIIKSMKRK
ncbi:MAG: DNA alkylation repair protein [Bacillota bacterium]|jgi:3-methyladenine DNA glycosylase AlkD